MLFRRETGILLHPTSLPGPWGIGTLGSEAEAFASWAAGSGATVWQVLPLSPPVYAGSPYQTLSTFAINPLLLSPEKLFEAGYLSRKEVAGARRPAGPSIDHHALAERHLLLSRAASRALNDPPPGFVDFLERRWVKEWRTFSSRKTANGERPWNLWTNRAPSFETGGETTAMIQFLLEEQWLSLRKHCESLGVSLLGDLPIYAAHDSSDVFYNRSIFKLDEDGAPAFLAGVPPDYFSSTGQLWGNPVYDWERSAATGHRWWTCRLRRAMELFHYVRIDHFRGFESYWEVPAGAETAREGRWVPGPGESFFSAVEGELGPLPVVAEDLGMITEEVRELRRNCGFPGMTVLQFALEDPSFDPAAVPSDTVVYTGTHDNDTSLGWITSRGNELGVASVKELIRMALDSPAQLAVIPVQDILELGSSARMNTPATVGGNWEFRLTGIPGPVSISRR
ncbi:MAG TPA: 4-alpha-glucanotransferase [Candidatus Sabulitectum sp.]|nr:4-alpha-glucanotransferase [Candidatus Sabulitectum sp.]HPF31415.1 4-alpha-glucanotransferase [Candidatus Sabulitectum sp.]HPJ27476.1 4-alpha-glucanotransferase [Candidatus Sabulitectum sp.]HPR21299.1 4-alpha-glucanotransferase [Candidatus Sabulitectum sp.]HRW77944.1 4-alpha-glucanotransferase [Candidatus Sabulitectum sp.]